MGTHPIFESDFDCLTERSRMNRILITPQRRLNFGWWYTGQSGLYRRIRGQGLAHQKQYDAMPMTEDPRVSQEHPRLQRWIKRRKRDQAWGDKWFPIFPDILFYVKACLFVYVWYVGCTTIATRLERSQRTTASLTRDYELEASFYGSSLVQNVYSDVGYWLEMVKAKMMSISGMGKQSKWSPEVISQDEKNYSEFKQGYKEHQDSRREDSWFYMNKPRIICGDDGDETLSLWAYGKLPLRLLSSVAGFAANLNLPVFMREPLYSTYGSAFGVDMSEAAEEDYRFYPTFNSFFRRALKPGVRPISTTAPLVSPADGKVLHVSKCESGMVEQVKGVNYSIRRFLGRDDITRSLADVTEAAFVEELKMDPNNELFQIVVYLAPGDYHRYHSSAKFVIKKRRYYPGDLFSVNPWLAHRMRDLFVLNERATLIGQWQHGFFSYCAVGATNVGSIIFHYDPELITNVPGSVKYGTFQEKDFTTIDPRIPEGLPVDKGEMVGEFNLGSTIVLIFEAPSNFEFTVAADDVVRVGEAIGRFN